MADRPDRYSFGYNSITGSTPVVFDVVSPTTTASLVPMLNPAGWTNTNVTATLAASDNIGGSG